MSQDTLIKPSRQLTLAEKLKSAPKLMIGKSEFTFDPNPLNDEWQARAAKELRETPENVEEALKVLRELLKGQCTFKYMYMYAYKILFFFLSKRLRYSFLIPRIFCIIHLADCIDRFAITAIICTYTV